MNFIFLGVVPKLGRYRNRPVIPAKAGIQKVLAAAEILDTRFRGHDASNAELRDKAFFATELTEGSEIVSKKISVNSVANLLIHKDQHA